MRRALKTLRRIWITVGAVAGAVFIVWSLLAYRASSEAHVAMRSTPEVSVSDHDGYWRFRRTQSSEIGVLFFPGALVDPIAYAPIAQELARRGYCVVLLRVPRRGAFGGAQSTELPVRYMRALRETVESGGPRQWVVAGHSLGGVISARLVQSLREGIAGLVLIGTSHPRDFSLSHLKIPVTQVYGTRDTIADVEKVEAARRNLPATTRFVRIDGGNHSQFASYGFQPGDWPATISRAEQRSRTIDAIVETIERARRDSAVK
jgi:alpha-beta hydrolase superfamily lysophospholipase